MFTSEDYCLADTTWQYFREFDDSSEGVVDFLESQFLSTISCRHGSYNELASLIQSTGHDSVSLLFASGVYNAFQASTLIIFMLVYMFLSVLAASLSVPAGMVVPSLCIGGCLGRLVALFYNFAIKSPLGLVPVDPGPWAMVGAAAFWFVIDWLRVGNCCLFYLFCFLPLFVSLSSITDLIPSSSFFLCGRVR